jgi:hypothetical protein
MEYTSNPLLAAAAFWGGLITTLLIFSSLLGDHALARLGRHLLVGAALGYAGLLAIQHVLRPRLITPLLADPTGDPLRWTPAVLGVILLVAGLDRMVRPTRRALPWWRRGLHGAGRLALALLLAVGLSAGFWGALQGTLIPQFRQSAQQAFDPTADVGAFLVGVLTLLITTGALLYLYVDPVRYVAEQPALVRRIMSGWLWLGQRAIWLTAGIIFARLMASRLSLLIARIDYLVGILYATPVGQWFAQTFFGGPP